MQERCSDSNNTPEIDSASASSEWGSYWSAAKAIDNNDITAWYGAPGAGSWTLTITLKQIAPVNKLSFSIPSPRWYWSDEYRIGVSEDGNTFEEVASGSSAPTEIEIANKRAKFIRIEMNGTPSGGAPGIQEVRVE